MAVAGPFWTRQQCSPEVKAHSHSKDETTLTSFLTIAFMWQHLFVLEICHWKKEWLDDWVSCLTTKARSSSSSVCLLVILFPFFFFLHKVLFALKTFPFFRSWNLLSVSSMAGLLHSSMETYSRVSLGVPCFSFFLFILILYGSCPNLKMVSSQLCLQFVVCLLSTHIWRRLFILLSAMALVSVQRIFFSWTHLYQPSASQKKGSLTFYKILINRLMFVTVMRRTFLEVRREFQNKLF